MDACFQSRFVPSFFRRSAVTLPFLALVLGVKSQILQKTVDYSGGLSGWFRRFDGCAC